MSSSPRCSIKSHSRPRNCTLRASAATWVTGSRGAAAESTLHPRHGGGRRPSNAHRAGPRARLAPGSRGDDLHLHAFISNRHTGSKKQHDETVDSFKHSASGPSWFSKAAIRTTGVPLQEALLRGVTGDLSDEPPTTTCRQIHGKPLKKENPTELHGSCEKCRTHENEAEESPRRRSNSEKPSTKASRWPPWYIQIFWLLNTSAR